MFNLFLWLIFGLTVAVRAYLLFSISGVPEINGAYYLVQARSVLETGLLGIPDLPLTFYLHAGLAKIAEFCGMPQSDAILLMVKLADAIIPSFVAIGIGYAIRNLLRTDGGGKSPKMINIIAIMGALVASLSLLPISMIGNYMKNSLGLVWMACMFLASINWIEDKTKKNSIFLLISLGLLGLTHIGVLGISLAILAAVGFFFILSGKFSWNAILKGASIITMLFGVALSIVWFYDSTRVEKLLVFFTGGTDFHGLSLSMMSFSNIGFMIIGLILLLIPNRFHTISKGLRSFLKGIALALVFLSGPWVSGDTAGRFSLILILPAVIVGAYLIWIMRKKLLQWFFLIIVGIATIIPTATHVHRGVNTVISSTAISEMQAAKSLITDTENSIIVAEHGTEWWAAWILGTDIIQNKSLTNDIWSSYTHVYYLKVTDGSGMGGGGGGGKPSGQSSSIVNTLLDAIGISTGVDDIGTPPQMGSGNMMPPPDRDNANMGNPPSGGPGGGTTIPDSATTIYSGSSIKIAEVTIAEYESTLTPSTSGSGVSSQ